MPNMSSNPSGGSSLRTGAQKNARRSGTRAFLFLGIGLIAAVSAGLLFSRYIAARTAAVRVVTSKVLVAAFDLPETTPIESKHFTPIDWPASSMPQGTIADPDKLIGRIVLTRIVKGEPILESRLASSDAGRGLAALLPSGMRAVSVRVDDVVGVAGFIHPGDSVDVIVTMKPREDSGSLTASKVILQNIRVLAVGQETQRKEGNTNDKAQVATVATLMVNSEQSEKLALAATRGKILLTLRGGTDGTPVDTRGIVPPELVSDGARAAPVQARSVHRSGSARPPVQAAVATPHEPKIVEILRGDLYERRDFSKHEMKGRP